MAHTRRHQVSSTRSPNAPTARQPHKPDQIRVEFSSPARSRDWAIDPATALLHDGRRRPVTADDDGPADRCSQLRRAGLSSGYRSGSPLVQRTPRRRPTHGVTDASGADDPLRIDHDGAPRRDHDALATSQCATSTTARAREPPDRRGRGVVRFRTTTRRTDTQTDARAQRRRSRTTAQGRVASITDATGHRDLGTL